MTAKQFFLVGAAPGRYPGHDPSVHALFPYPPGCTGHRLWRMTGLARSQYVAIPRRNVIKKYPGRDSVRGGDAFPMSNARAGAKELLPELLGHHVVFMGKATAKAFDLRGEFLDWHMGKPFNWAILPHPSGRNRWYNRESNRAAAEEFMRKVGREHLEWLLLTNPGLAAVQPVAGDAA